jgi:hypothetical protein
MKINSTVHVLLYDQNMIPLLGNGALSNNKER